MVNDEVIGAVFSRLPIIRRSCSLFKLWINEPEQRNSSALKKECVVMWRKARVGWFNPSIVIISPSWLVVDRAMIFLMSCCVIAAAAANIVVVAPMIRHIVFMVGLLLRIGWSRISRNTPATTMVLE